MTDFTEDIVKAIGDEVTPQLSRNLGVGNDVAGKILPLVAPLLVSALKRKKDDEGSEKMESLLHEQADEFALDDLANTIERRANEPSDETSIGGLLGGVGEAGARLLSEKLGLNSGQSRNAIYILAPIVLGYLVKKGKSGGVASGLASIIDANGDGRIMDDVGGMLIQHIASKRSFKTGGSGLVEGILGGLLK